MADLSRKTERPTAKRLHKARRDGNIPRSKEFPGALSLAGFLLFCHMAGGEWMSRAKAMMATFLSNLSQADIVLPDASALFMVVGTATASLLTIPLGVLVAAGVGGNLLQGPPPLTLKPLRPDLSKLNPAKGLKKIFGWKPWVEVLKTALKLVLFSVIAITAVRETMDAGLPGAPGAEGTWLALVAVGGKVIFRVLMLAMALAILDYMFTRYDHTRRLKMTKQEVKDERKELEGDPLVKARVRSKQMSMARSRMMADVAKASVVVTNPTQYAVALRYVPGEMPVPQLLAKGRAKLAERIREIAKEHDIPIVSDPPLARALYRAVQVGGFIPERLFRAVAEVLALVLRDRARGRRPQPPVEEA